MTNTIESVIENLDQIVKSCHSSRSPLGYFAALYKRVTILVSDAIVVGSFEDNPRMEKLDIVFANRFLTAWDAHQKKEPLSESWRIAFDSERNTKLIVLQHLLLGMNAHIGLDLGIAAATTSNSDPLSLKNDFLAINNILGSLVDDTQRRLTRVFGLLGLADRLMGPIDEKLSIFSIGYARDRAWTQTLELCLASPEERTSLIASRDASVAKFSEKLICPSRAYIRLILLLIRILEKGDVPQRISILNTLTTQP